MTGAARFLSAPPGSFPRERTARDAWIATLAVVGALTVVRIAILWLTPLELNPDEAQYWLWSRRLAWGYFSKPPMIAWLIRATTTLGGDAEPFARLSSPLLHAVAALALQRAGARFGGPWTGFRAAVVYALMPGVQVSSAIVSTDAPLLAFLSLSLWALGAFWTTPRARGARPALAFGAALGLACLSKYAGLYLAAGLAVHALADPNGRRRLWSAWRVALATVAFALVVAPNVAWNVANHFQTVSHTVADASLGDAEPARGLDPRGALGFLFGQLGVFGPVSFVVLAAGSWRAVRARSSDAAERLLLILTAPPLAIVLVEAVLVRANANWAAAAYAPGSLLVAAWLGGERGRRVFGWGMALQAVAAALVAAAVVSPAAATALHVDNGLKRARGWRAAAAVAREQVDRAKAAGPVTALAVDDRFMFNALAYYGRDWLAAPGEPPLRMWVHEAHAKNQAEAASPLTPAQGARVAFVSTAWPKESRWDFRGVSDLRHTAVRLDAHRERPMLLFVGQGFEPRPRDPRTGLPVAP